MAKHHPPITVEKAVRKLQLSLLENGCHEIQLAVAGCLMSRSDYSDVVTERSIANLCGFPLCQNPLPTDQPRKGRYRISRKDKDLIDLQEHSKFCSSDCVKSNRTFTEYFFQSERRVLSGEKVEKIVRLFEELGVEVDEILKVGGELGLKEKKDELWRKFHLGVPKLTSVEEVSGEEIVEEKTKGGLDLGAKDLKIEENIDLDLKGGVVQLVESVGPSNAIEGYVPRASKAKAKHGEEGSKTKMKSITPRKGKEKVTNEMDFTSTIIMGDPFSVPQVSSGHKLKSSNTSIEDFEGDESNNVEASTAPVQKVLELESKGDLSTLLMESQLGIPELLYGPSEYVSTKSAKESTTSRHDQGSKSKTKSAGRKKEKAKVQNEMDFTSRIVIGDSFSVPQGSSGSKLKSSNKNMKESEGNQSKNLEASPPVQKVSELDSKGDLSSLIMESRLGIPELHYGSNENVSTKGTKESIFTEEPTVSNGITLKSSVRSSGAKTLRRNVTWADERQAGNMSTGNLCEFQELDVIPSNSNKERRSSRRSSAAKNLKRNITWADKSKTNNMSNGDLCEVRQVGDILESAEGPSKRHMEDSNGTILLESAEACVLAMSQAAEAVASGVSDVEDAVSEAGIVILPQPHGDSPKEDDVEQELAPFELSMKPDGLQDYYLEDSWFEAPPEGFSLTLSAFSTMWMALFEWITSSSLAYIYGKDESSQEEFSLVNGREYPCRIVSSDGRSPEIKQTLAVCLGRALPEVATNLRLKTPISAMEKGLDQLLNTMTLMNAVPPFKFRQWHVIALLFLDALSVCRIPGLASHMTTGRKLLNKVLDGAQVSEEEYEIMKDLIIPLGRVPQFSAQNGG